jgi:hypothetical protein
LTTSAAQTTIRTALPGVLKLYTANRAAEAKTPRYRRVLLIVTAWLATRIPLYLTDRGTFIPSYGHMSTSDIAIYSTWVRGYLTHGTLPKGVTWQYPPLVGPLLLMPQLMPGAVYLTEFINLALLADAAVFCILVWTAPRRGSWLGPWFWILGGALLGPIIYGRFDVFATFFPVAALAMLGSGVPAPGGGRMLNSRRWVAGALIGVGVALKFWPGMALFGLPRTKRGLQASLGAVIVGGGATLACALCFNGGAGFLGEQGARGIEIESVWALPFLLAHRAGAHSISYQILYGSLEVVRPGLSNAAADLALLSTAIGFAVLGWWWWRKAWRPAVSADAAFVGTLISTVTSRVISPQYMIWLLGTAAFCLLFKDTTQRRSALLFLPALPLTQLDFPITFTALREGHLSPIMIVGLRDALLLAATVIGMRDLWRSTVTGRFWSLKSLRRHPEQARTAGRAGAEAIEDEKSSMATAAQVELAQDLVDQLRVGAGLGARGQHLPPAGRDHALVERLESGGVGGVDPGAAQHLLGVLGEGRGEPRLLAVDQALVHAVRKVLFLDRLVQRVQLGLRHARPQLALGLPFSRVVPADPQQPDERRQRQALDDEREQHHHEGGEQDRAASRERLAAVNGEGDGEGEGDRGHAAHPGPPHHDRLRRADRPRRVLVRCELVRCELVCRGSVSCALIFRGRSPRPRAGAPDPVRQPGGREQPQQPYQDHDRDDAHAVAEHLGPLPAHLVDHGVQLLPDQAEGETGHQELDDVPEGRADQPVRDVVGVRAIGQVKAAHKD